MYRINFYDQTSFRPLFTTVSLTGTRSLGSLPQGPMPSALPFRGKDDFGAPLTSFEVTLHQEVQNITRLENALDLKLKGTNKDQFTPEEKQQLMDQYSSIQQAKKLLAMIVEQMQKCAASISANFR